MNFYIRRNSILPTLKMKLIFDGRNDYKRFHDLLENSVVTFSMKNVNNGVYKVANKEGKITKVTIGDIDEYYVEYDWIVNDTNELGQFEGEFKIKFLDDCSHIIVPIRENLYVNVLTSFTKGDIEENNNLIDSDGCLIFCDDYLFTGGTVSGSTEFLSDVNICEGDLYVHNILGCSPITINNNLEVDENLFTISGETKFLNTLTGTTAYFDNIFSGNTDLSQLIINTFTTGGTYSNNSITLTRNDNVNIVITGITDYFTTGSTFDSNTKIATFNRNDGNNYTLDLSTLSTVDTYTTGFTYNGVNTFTIKQNEGQPDLTATIDTIQTTGDITAGNFYGNGSNLSGINFSQLATTAHTHSISDVINLQTNLNSKIDKPLNPFLGDYLYYNGVNWVPNQINIPVAAGAGVTLFLSLTGSSLPSYEYLSQFPIELTETQESVVINNSQSLIGKYATDQLNRTVIDSGIWEFNTFASVDTPSTGLTQIIISAFLLTSGGSETFLFSGATENITTTSPNIYTFSLAEPQYSCNTTDYLVVNYSASTTNNFNTTVTLYHGGTLNYSHIRTPFITLHNDLAGIQGGFSNEHYHLSKNEVDLLTTGIDSSSIHNHDSLYLGLGGGIVSGQTNFTNGLYSNSLSGDTIFSGGTLLQTIIENIVLSNSPVYIRRHDFTGDTINSTSYCGTAPDGSLENQPFWDITKIDIPLIGSGTTSTYASGVTWTGRYTHIYT
jgi:hypothetical protein